MEKLPHQDIFFDCAFFPAVESVFYNNSSFLTNGLALQIPIHKQSSNISTYKTPADWDKFLSFLTSSCDADEDGSVNWKYIFNTSWNTPELDNEMILYTQKDFIKDSYDNFKLPKQINTKIIAEAESLVIFCDCELQGNVKLGLVKANQPITFFAYCLNTGKSIYLTLQPNILQFGQDKYGVNLHKITLTMVREYHKLPVSKGMEILIQWINMQKETCFGKNCDEIVNIFAHSAQTEMKAIFNNCPVEELPNTKNFKFRDTVRIAKNIVKKLDGEVESDDLFSPLATQLYGKSWMVEDSTTFSLDAISKRLNLGDETHNAIDDTVLLLGVCCIWFKSFTPQQLISNLLKPDMLPQETKSIHDTRVSKKRKDTSNESKKLRKCSNCNETGHNIRKCPKKQRTE